MWNLVIRKISDKPIFNKSLMIIDNIMKLKYVPPKNLDLIISKNIIHIPNNNCVLVLINKFKLLIF